MAATQETIHDKIEISACPTKITIKTEKTYKERKIKEIIAAVSALLNSSGGKLVLRYEKTPPKHHVVDCVRIIEQRVKDLTSCGTVAKLTLDVGPQQLIINVNKSEHIVTTNYNLHLPSESQVMSLPPSEPIKNIKEILRNSNFVHINKDEELESHQKYFVKGEVAGLRESKRVAVKNLKAIPSKCVTLADRMTGRSNKFANYVSAFGNHSGGHIYYGINEEGKVEGEEITEKDRKEIEKKVTNAINKMIWPAGRKPERGRQWDIYFEPVTNANGGIIPSTFVIVVYVAQCPGGVFVEQPECYHIEKGRVEKMRFENWLSHFTECPVPVPSHVSKVSWSSQENGKIFRELTTQLVSLRNDNKMSEFKVLSEFSKKMFPRTNASLVVISEKVIASCKKHNFRKSENLLSEYKVSLKNAQQDHRIFEVKELYLKSRVESAKGSYEKSLAIAMDGLRSVQLIPAGLITVWFYIHAATITMIISDKKKRSEKREILLRAQEYLEFAKRAAKSLKTDNFETDVTDLYQKLHISLAANYLKIAASFNSNPVGETDELMTNVEAAESELKEVRTLCSQGHPLTAFRWIQNHLAWCQLFYQRSHLTEESHQIAILKKAYDHGTEARRMAGEYGFEEMVHRANECLADVTEKIVRNFCKTRKRP